MNTACGRALELDVVSVSKIAAMLHKATENTPAEAPRRPPGWLRPGLPATRVNTAAKAGSGPTG
ncbi:hypothetical protein I553_10532 [Mycobacterium xenopi 4042]|uniref:Uncharacterized protein n=1 Tax=Mycobacterium xenopi 4042 TaxID=1299334 RepID=X8DIB4_MYCXE|nr:hypothetical protein I553_10532 [Mycobacterium xenopi 4042]